MTNQRTFSSRLITSALFLTLSGVAHAEPVQFDGGGGAFFVIIAAMTGTMIWWRHTAGDRLGALAVWATVMVTAMMVTRYGPDDTLNFFAHILGT